MDQDRIKANTAILLDRWGLLKCATSFDERSRIGARLAMNSEAVELLCMLDRRQVARAGDCDTPLFTLAYSDGMVIQALSAEEPPRLQPGAGDAVDQQIVKENLVMLVNRWGIARASPQYAQYVLGMSTWLIAAFQRTSIFEIHRAAHSGLRFVKLACDPRYFFHAGLHIGVQRANRSLLAACASIAPGP